MAASKGFWDLKKSFLDLVAAHLGLASCSTTFELLSQLVRHILECSESEVLDCLAHRLASADKDMAHAAALAELDEGIQVLDQRDHQEVKSSVQDSAGSTCDRAQFSAAFRAKRVAVRSAAAKSQAKKRGRSAQASAPRPFPNTIAQSEARLYIPDGSSIWLSNTRFAWCAHVPPRSRISEPWQKHGSDQAALQCILRRMWRQHCELSGIAEADCPWALSRCQGDVSGAAGASASGASLAP